jgi:hypothetical protein
VRCAVTCRQGYAVAGTTVAYCKAVLPQAVRHLDVDDVAGEIDQDWCEGRSPFSQDSLPDGGGGSAERVVPDHFGTDWAAEIGNRDVRMKADHVKTTASTEEVSSRSGETGHWSRKWRRNTSRAVKKPLAEWKKDLQTGGTERKSREIPTLVVGKKPNGKSQFKPFLKKISVPIQYSMNCSAKTPRWSWNGK